MSNSAFPLGPLPVRLGVRLVAVALILMLAACASQAPDTAAADTFER